jgi:hypothetical protein
VGAGGAAGVAGQALHSAIADVDITASTVNGAAIPAGSPDSQARRVAARVAGADSGDHGSWLSSQYVASNSVSDSAVRVEAPGAVASPPTTAPGQPNAREGPGAKGVPCKPVPSVGLAGVDTPTALVKRPNGAGSPLSASGDGGRDQRAQVRSRFGPTTAAFAGAVLACLIALGFDIRTVIVWVSVNSEEV